MQRLLLLALFLIGPLIELAYTDEVRVVAHIGDSLPDGNGGFVQISQLSNFPNATIPQISESGHAVFMAQVTGNGVTASNNTGIWRIGPDNQLELIARNGSGVWAPGAGLLFNRFFTPKVNSVGQSAFGAELGGTGVTASNTKSFWTLFGSSQLLLAREGTNAPIGSGVTFGAFSDQHLKYTSTGGIFTFKSTLLGTGITSSNNRAFGKLN